MPVSRTRRGVGLALVVATLGLVVCSVACSGNGKASPPSTYTFGINFLSIGAAVQVDTLEVSLFDLNATHTDCQTLFFARVSGAQLPPTAIPVENVSTCDVAVSQAGGLTVPYGTYAVLVVAKQGTVPLYAGCAAEAATSGDDPANPPIVELTRFNASVPVPPATTCTTIADHCAGRC